MLILYSFRATGTVCEKEPKRSVCRLRLPKKGSNDHVDDDHSAGSGNQWGAGCGGDPALGDPGCTYGPDDRVLPTPLGIGRLPR